MAKKKQIRDTAKKIEESKRMFAKIFNAQTGNKISTMNKLLENIHEDLDSTVFEDKKLATDTLIKILPYVMPRESNGSQMNVQINNNNGGGVDSPENVIQTIDKFLVSRLKVAEEVKERADKKNKLNLREIGTVKQKDGKPDE